MKMIRYKAEKNEEKHRKIHMAFENRNKEIYQKSFDAYGEAMTSLKERHQLSQKKEIEFEQQKFNNFKMYMSM